MPQFHDVENDRGLETFTQQHGFALYRAPAKLGKKKTTYPTQTVSEDKQMRSVPFFA